LRKVQVLKNQEIYILSLRSNPPWHVYKNYLATVKIKKQVKPRVELIKSEIKTHRVSSVDKRIIPASIFSITKPVQTIKKAKVNSVEYKTKAITKTSIPISRVSSVKPDKDLLTICCKNAPEDLKRIAITILDKKSVNLQIMKVFIIYLVL
jgi:hypothetical protein